MAHDAAAAAQIGDKDTKGLVHEKKLHGDGTNNAGRML